MGSPVALPVAVSLPQPAEAHASARIVTPEAAAPAGQPVEAAVAQVNQHLQQQGQADLSLQVDPGSGRTVYRIVQEGTGQVLLQVPSAEVLGMSRRVREIGTQKKGSGALVDKEG
jgi:uncharacterized FlaG/YvyC family protein